MDSGMFCVDTCFDLGTGLLGAGVRPFHGALAICPSPAGSRLHPVATHLLISVRGEHLGSRLLAARVPCSTRELSTAECWSLLLLSDA